jgi:hypothetical protein
MKEFIPYEQALELKELGFDEYVLEYYNTETKDFCHVMKEIKAPLFQQAFRWFREKCSLHGEIFGQLRPSNNFMYALKIAGTDIMNDGFKTYEEAELACLNKLIEILKKKKD